MIRNTKVKQMAFCEYLTWLLGSDIKTFLATIKEAERHELLLVLDVLRMPDKRHPPWWIIEKIKFGIKEIKRELGYVNL